MLKETNFSHAVSIFHDRLLPEGEVLLAGYSALVAAYDLQVPMPDLLSAISHKHKKYQMNAWMMFSPRHAPHGSLYGHLTFALKNEGINLSILKTLFDSIDTKEIITIVHDEPTGSYSRRIWFLYEWLQGMQLEELPDADKGNVVDVLDAALQYPGSARYSKRHRVQNNLPGVPAFCPTIRRTENLDKLISLNLSDSARKILGTVEQDILIRAAAFMLLKDSKASFAIEREIPPQTRAERWGQAIGEAGRNALSHDEFLRLQQIIIADFRFTHLGYRNEGGFVGDHDRTGLPIPEHISARWQDLYFLMDGLIATNSLLKKSDMDAVLSAAIIAFGFVFIHPLEDGNGRLHRYLIHHVLAEKKFNPDHIVFPVSAVILDRINEYREILEAFSRPRLKLIKWQPTDKGNIEVLNNTINWYRYFDATKQAEFLYSCIKDTIEKTLPEEMDYLKKYDEMKHFIKNYLDMPDRLVDLLIRFLKQENGKLSKRARGKEFSSLREDEIKMLEKKYVEIFK